MGLTQKKSRLTRIHWQLWVEDRFDPQSHRRVEKEGVGLIAGLKALWDAHMREGISPEGRETFSKFNLWSKDLDQSFEIQENAAAMEKIHGWLFTHDNRSPFKKTLKNSGLLNTIVQGHYGLILRGEGSLKILEAAEAAADCASFSTALKAIAGEDALQD